MLHRLIIASLLLSPTINVVTPSHAAAAGNATDEDKASEKRLKAHVYYCSDGDTCRMQVESAMWVNVRFAAIDAPEVSHKRRKDVGQTYGNESRDHLNGLIKDKDVELRQVDLDAYNRPVVEVFLAGTNVNRKMVEDGFAEMYRGRTKRLDKSLYQDAEDKARKAKVGIWSLSSYESPSLFRKQQKR